MNTTRKPFVAPQIKEEASLVGVTLISGHGCKRGQPTLKKGFRRNNLRRGSYRGH